MSLHTDRSIAKARQHGAFAGQAAAQPLWGLSKRELLEVAIRLGAQAAHDPDNAAAGISTVTAELRALRDNRVI